MNHCGIYVHRRSKLRIKLSEYLDRNQYSTQLVFVIRAQIQDGSPSTFLQNEGRHNLTSST